MSKWRTAQIVVMGVTGSGKSTVASILSKRLNCEMAEADAFHSAANIAKMSSGIPLDDHDRWPWLKDIASWIREHDRRERATVVACSALRRAYRDILRAASHRVRFVHLMGPRELITERMHRREKHFMPPSLLDSQWATLEPLGPDENGITLDVSQPLEERLRAVLGMVGHPPEPVSAFRWDRPLLEQP
jgi:gluconokinase